MLWAAESDPAAACLSRVYRPTVLPSRPSVNRLGYLLAVIIAPKHFWSVDIFRFIKMKVVDVT